MSKNKIIKLPITKRQAWINIFLTILAISLMLFGGCIILRDQTMIFAANTAEVPDVTFPPIENTVLYEAKSTIIPTNIPTVVPTNTPEPTPIPPIGSKEPSAPISIYFVRQNISVAIVPVGLNANGSIETVSKPDIAAWYKLGAHPNEFGNCIINGHNSWKGQCGLFSVLHKDMELGDQIIITLEDGSYIFYIVEEMQRFPYNAVPKEYMKTNCDEQKLTLITCLGDWDSSIHTSRTRVFVICKPVACS